MIDDAPDYRPVTVKIKVGKASLITAFVCTQKAFELKGLQPNFSLTFSSCRFKSQELGLAVI